MTECAIIIVINEMSTQTRAILSFVTYVYYSASPLHCTSHNLLVSG